MASASEQRPANEIEALERQVLAALDENDRAAHSAYSAGEICPAGAHVSYSGLDLTADRDFLVGFVDEMPGGNWTHPCRYLVAPNTGVQQVTAQNPPAFGRLAPPWRLVYSAPLVEDWQLMTSVE